MTVRERVQRTQRGLEIITAISAAMWASAAALAAFVVVEMLAALAGVAARWPAGAAATLAAMLAAAWLIWRSRFVWSLDRVALWIEEREPELRYSVVTAADPRYAPGLDPIASPMLGGLNTAQLVRHAAVGAIRLPAAALAIAVAAVVFLPTVRMRAAATHDIRFTHASTAALLAGSKLTPLTAHVVPPAYTGLRADDIDEPSTINGVQGSSVLLSGDGTGDGIAAAVSYANGRRARLAVTSRGNRWNVAVAMTDTTPALIELTDRAYTRSIVLNPRADAPPKVQLRLPARDTALRTAAGALRLSADVSDDFGLAGGSFEYIISSGSEETYNFKQGTLGAASFGGAKQGTLAVTVPYSFFKLGEGDRLSIRAVATDLNSLTGPGKGFSETRTIRVARKDEYDSLAVEAAAPSGDTAMMSLRMLIIETEKLDAERPKLLRDSLVARSRTLAHETDDVRESVLPLFREEGTGAPEVAVDTESTEATVEVAALVRSALNDLEESSRKLDVADPHSALPPMRNAYKSLQSFRNFKRYYFRGATRPVIVDIQRVRLTGKTKGSAAAIAARPSATSDRDRMRATYAAAIEQIGPAPKTAVSMLTMLRVESLLKFPPLSAALDEALSAIAGGRDATSALVRARRLLEVAPVRTDSIPAWSGGW